MGAIRLLLADDHSLFREGLVRLLRDHPQFEVVGEARDGLDAVAIAERVSPDIVLLDLRMPRCGGLEAARLLRAQRPGLPIVILAESEDEDSFFEGIAAGVTSYVSKTSEFSVLLDSLALAVSGQAALPPAFATRLLATMAGPRSRGSGPRAPLGDLTEREVDVMGLLSEGATNKEIARALSISENTVRSHVRNIMEKLKLQNRVQAATYGIRGGFARSHEEGRGG